MTDQGQGDKNSHNSIFLELFIFHLAHYEIWWLMYIYIYIDR